MITKEQLTELKQNNLSGLHQLIQEKSDSREILFVLENLGYLPRGFDASILVPFLKHQNDQVRLWTVKNLGKVSDARYLKLLLDSATHDTDSMVRREAVSSIGRMRNPKAIPYLTQLLNDSDPKIVLQAIRGLLVFRANLPVKQALENLATHPNEMVQSVIRKEFHQTANGHEPKEEHLNQR